MSRGIESLRRLPAIALARAAAESDCPAAYSEACPPPVLRSVLPSTWTSSRSTAAGTLLLGVEDKTRNVRGVSDALDVEERFANIVSDSIAPRLLPEIGCA